MLIRFSVENFLSFKERQTLSMIPGKTQKHKAHICTNSANKNIDILRGSIIYGANASGKSNLIYSMYHCKKLITLGIRAENKLPHFFFRLDSLCKDKPSVFEFEFSIRNRNYAYGFSLNSEKILEEWLYLMNKSKDVAIYERTTDENNKTIVNFNTSKFKNNIDLKFLKFIGKGTRPNQLFITECIQRNVKNELRKIPYFIDTINWFDNVLSIIFPESKYGGTAFEIDKDENFKKRYTNLLKLFDTDIDGLNLKKVNLKEEFKELPNKLFEDLEKKVKKGEEGILSGPNDNLYAITRNEQGELELYKIMTEHYVTNTNETINFDIDDESDGTRRILDLIPSIIDIKTNDKVYIIDELDRSLHPIISNAFINIFLNEKHNRNSQIIVTTHESSLLNQDLIRKDEVWFIEKDKKSKESILYSLEEFKPRFDNNIRKGYLLGRFGAIPFVPNLSRGNWLE